MMDRLKRLIDFRDEIEGQRKRLSKEPDGARLEGGLRQTLNSNASAWHEAFGAHGFVHAEYVALDLQQSTHKVTYGEAVRKLADVDRAFMEDISKRMAFVIANERIIYFDAGFSPDVSRAFPEATKEIKEAGTCLALGRHMASVFHLMRGVEQGMRAVAVAVGQGTPAPKVPLEYQMWQTVIDGIESKTKKVPDGWQDPARSNGRAFFSGTVADLFAFKDETRNICMHTRNGFHDFPGAQSVRNRVEKFFARLIGKVEENGSRSLLDPSLFV